MVAVRTISPLLGPAQCITYRTGACTYMQGSFEECLVGRNPHRNAVIMNTFI